jgi:hypothetical protein
MWAAHSSPPYPKVYKIGQDIDSTRREVAAQILEEIAKDVRNGRHKPSLIISITHGYLRDPRDSVAEIEIQERALRDFADTFKERCNTLKP